MDPVRITSISNSTIKEARSLHEKKGRQSAQAFLLEGFRLVSEALDSGAEIRYFIVADKSYEKNQEILSRCPEAKIVQVPDDLFDRISETQTPQGIIAAAELPQYPIQDIMTKMKRAIVLENIQDPGNLGTIIRAADACGFDGVLLSKDSADPFNPKVVRSTMGSLFHLPVLVLDDIYKNLEFLRENGLKIAAAHLRDAVPCWQADLSDNIAIVIGNEGNGITEKMLSLADLTITVPMPGRTESLNASSAASILLYESMRQKNSSNPFNNIN